VPAHTAHTMLGGPQSQSSAPPHPSGVGIPRDEKNPPGCVGPSLSDTYAVHTQCVLCVQCVVCTLCTPCQLSTPCIPSLYSYTPKR